jgi:hypothetical protein
MKKTFPILLMFLGLAFVGASGYTINRGYDAKNQVRQELLAQRITTTPDARVPNVRVHDAATAKVMADIIDKHAREATGGKTYSEMGRFLSKTGGDTNDAAQAVLGADGKPLANPARTVAFQASSLRTSLFTSIMAFKIADLVVGIGVLLAALGIAVGGVGLALAGLAIPAVGRRFHVNPAATAAS